MSAIKEYASDRQAFLGGKIIETEIKKHEIYLQSLFKDGNLQKIDFNCQIEDKISDVLCTVTSFGSISVELSSPLVELQMEKDKQAQIRRFLRAPPTPTNDLKMTLKRKFEFNYVTGCCFSSTGDIFLVDNYKKRLLILKEDGTLKTGIHLASFQGPVDVTCIDDKTVAVSCQYSYEIQIINLLTKTIQRTINTTSKCNSICFTDGNFVCYTVTGIQKVNMTGYCSSTTVKDDTLANWSYVDTSKNKICYTNYSKATVACCSLTGEKMWEYNRK
ncbi:Hypothetical predicted protein [Mytilus galloprovincialis]|uniref:Uncharacterized protein n=1 Tax=Mytilus galloprovincialis TaxID=29158 RepID=A0A8B6FBS0_MYTGA|nr:Hypothetical predicted protein [Mytilus galloprovincialis]